MKNKKGIDGIINHTGLPGAPSELIDCREDDFWDNIEEGIKSTVKVVIECGFMTVSSCQGHEASNPFRCVSIIGEVREVRWIQYVVAIINQTANFAQPIQYSLLEKNTAMKLYDGMFERPIIIDISFGDCRRQDTSVKQKAFEKYLSEYDRYDIDDELDERLVAPFMHNDSHYDVFF